MTSKISAPVIVYRAGSVCLDVINQTWSPMFDLVNIFSIFLPQLLLYPNPKDPLNSEAAALLNSDSERYKSTVQEYVKRYAQEDNVRERHSALLKSQKANCGAMNRRE